MTIISIVGLQWGDEGKGKIVDFLSENSDVVVRFQGGHNAGHTIVIGDKTYKLNLLPSNILRGDKISVIGNGVVVDPFHLITEIEKLEESGIKVGPEQLIIAENAPIILPIHKLIDELNENIRAKGGKIGTTGRGIGPTYSDKVSRRAVRICDLDDKEIIEARIDEILSFYSPLLKQNLDKAVSKTEILKDISNIAEKIMPFVAPSWKILNELQSQGKTIMFEGAQGVMLDIDHGTYPFVTSSNTVTSQAFAGSGLGCQEITHNIAVVKAYTTRVGEGPFPSELANDTGLKLQEKGFEFGTVTGRDRRCGWIDLVQLKQMIKICGINSIALTKLDVLSEFEKIGLCIKYDIDGKEYDYLPAAQKLQRQAKPILIDMPGWQEDISEVKEKQDLPDNALAYIEKIEKELETKIDIISTGPRRDQTIILKDYFN